MFFITKYRHNKIVEQYQEAITDLKEELYRKDQILKIVDKLADRTNNLSGRLDDSCKVSSVSVMESLDDTIPRYVPDMNGGKVIKQEATPVTKLDVNGKATYGYTREKPDAGYNYQLKQEPGF